MSRNGATEPNKTVEELVSFLSHPRAEIRKSASGLLISLTATDQGIHQLLQLSKPDVIQGLCRIISDMRPIAEDGIKALINLTAANPLACERTLKFDIINRVMSQIDDNEWLLKDLSMMLLANITTIPEAARKLLGYIDNRDENNVLVSGTDDKMVAVREKQIRKLTELFLQSTPEPDGVDLESNNPTWDDDYQYIANVLSNISQLEEGRAFLLKHNKLQDGTLISALLPQLKSPNVVRRRGIVSTIRNLCFDTDNHFYLYDQLDIPTHMMVLLAGPEPLDDEDKVGMSPNVYRLGSKKKREHDRQVRLAAVDSLLLLCTTRNGRTDLRRKKVYPIVRNAHLVESEEDIGDQIYKLVDFLIRDEEGEEPDWNDIRTKAYSDDAETVDNIKKQTNNKDDIVDSSDISKEIKNDVDTPSMEATRSTAHSLEDKQVKGIVSSKPSENVNAHADEDVDDEIAAALVKEIDLLDVSSDEEDDNTGID